jgi:hypothetical protein
VDVVAEEACWSAIKVVSAWLSAGITVVVSVVFSDSVMLLYIDEKLRIVDKNMISIVMQSPDL